MAKNNPADQDFTNNADGFTLGGGTTERTVTITGGNVTITGGGGVTITYPSSTGTLATLANAETFTNKTLTGAIGSSPLLNEPTIVISTDYPAIGRFNVTSLNGSQTVSDLGITLSTSATATSYTRNLLAFGLDNNNYNVWGGALKFATIISLNCAGTTKGQWYGGISNITVVGGSAGHTFTGNHIGYKMIGNGTSVSLYGTVADGTTEAATSALTTVAQNDIIFLRAVIIGSTNVAFYYNQNFGGWIGPANVTTHIPTSSSGSPYIQQSVTNIGQANDFNITSSFASVTY
jgi:hypothetical protein